MKLRQKELKDIKIWEDAGFELPKFDRDKMIRNTKENPEWIHFGAGNIFRAFPAAVCQELLNKGILNKGILNTGIIVAEGYDYEIIEKSYKTFDNLSVLVTLKSDGSLVKKVVGNIAESLCVDTSNVQDWSRLKAIFENPGLKMVSFTITEKGYSLTNNKNEYIPDVADDFMRKPNMAISYIGKLAALCYNRFLNHQLPITLVSLDNCSHNGSRLEEAVTTFAKKRVQNKMVGFEDSDSIVTSKNTYVAPFVNAEEPQYLVIEDNFKNGRLPLDKGGIKLYILKKKQ